MKKRHTIPRRIWVFFCSVKLTVYTLLLLAVTSIIGTVILQNGDPRQYVALYGDTLYRVINTMQIDDMYRAWWFLLLLLLLCINIVVCSVERLSLTWKTIFPEKVRFSPDRFLRSSLTRSFDLALDAARTAETCERWLARQAGPVLKNQDGDTLSLYAEKGRWTRLGVYVVHASVLLLLAGALIGAVFGFKASVRLDEGKQTRTVFNSRTQAPIDLEFVIRCNTFDVRFYDTGAPEEFTSNLTIIENGQESFSTDIRVNHPLRYKGINIFQSSYGTATPDAAELTLIDNQTGNRLTRHLKVGESMDLPDNAGTFQLQGFLPHFDFSGHNLGETFFGLVSIKGAPPRQIGMPVKFPMFDKMRKGRFTVMVKNFEQRYYTGLQVTRDPGVWYVYAGFMLMILGCWVTFFMSHQSFFIAVQAKGAGRVRVSLSGRTNRSRQGMRLKLDRMAARLQSRLTPETKDV